MERRLQYRPKLATNVKESTHVELARIKDSIHNEISKIVYPKRSVF